MDSVTLPLEDITDQFIANTGYTPYIAAEIEFYLSGELTKEFSSECYTQFGSAGIITHAFEEEDAVDKQYEISLMHLPSPLVAANNLLTVKNIVSKTAEAHNIEANFTAKLYEEKPGNGLHIHISLMDKQKHNVFQKVNEEESPVLLQAIGGLCDTMAEAMVFFAPQADDYKRFHPEFYDGKPCYSNSPINISWGGNNRTTAIRIPTSTLEPEQRHIEHRVAGANADPHSVISAILLGIEHGLTQKINPSSDKLWGNAFDAQYDLPTLPQSLEEAQKAYNEGNIIKNAMPLK